MLTAVSQEAKKSTRRQSRRALGVSRLSFVVVRPPVVAHNYQAAAKEVAEKIFCPTFAN